MKHLQMKVIDSISKKLFTSQTLTLCHNNILHLKSSPSNSGVDPTKLFFFPKEEFFRFSLVSLHFYYIQKNILIEKMTKLNAEEKKTEKKNFGRIDS